MRHYACCVTPPIGRYTSNNTMYLKDLHACHGLSAEPTCHAHVAQSVLYFPLPLTKCSCSACHCKPYTRWQGARPPPSRMYQAAWGMGGRSGMTGMVQDILGRECQKEAKDICLRWQVDSTLTNGPQWLWVNHPQNGVHLFSCFSLQPNEELDGPILINKLRDTLVSSRNSGTNPPYSTMSPNQVFLQATMFATVETSLKVADTNLIRQWYYY